jgi:taurine transport system substrate-binding protein
MIARRTLLATMSAMLLAGVTATAAMAEKVVIGHFGTPIPLQAAIAAKDFEKATGWEIESSQPWPQVI